MSSVMMDNVREFLGHYKSVIVKTCLILFFIFMVVQYNSYGKRSSAHYLHLQIQNGSITNICIAPSKNIFTDNRGTYAVVKNSKIYISDEWSSLAARDNLFLAIPTTRNHSNTIYEIDDINAGLILQNGETEGCRSYVKLKKGHVG